MFNNDPQTDSDDDEEKAKALEQKSDEDNDATEARKRAFQSIRNSFGNK